MSEFHSKLARELCLYQHLTKGLPPLPFGNVHVLVDFSLTVKAATLIFISGCGSAISSAKEGK